MLLVTVEVADSTVSLEKKRRFGFMVTNAGRFLYPYFGRGTWWFLLELSTSGLRGGRRVLHYKLSIRKIGYLKTPRVDDDL